uniref:SET domain-containing protein n=1 Tax=Alexandrium monilatum TaxID=311494 RepID=A0A7S4R0B8_9DINO
MLRPSAAPGPTGDGPAPTARFDRRRLGHGTRAGIWHMLRPCVTPEPQGGGCDHRMPSSALRPCRRRPSASSDQRSSRSAAARRALAGGLLGLLGRARSQARERSRSARLLRLLGRAGSQAGERSQPAGVHVVAEAGDRGLGLRVSQDVRKGGVLLDGQRPLFVQAAEETSAVTAERLGELPAALQERLTRLCHQVQLPPRVVRDIEQSAGSEGVVATLLQVIAVNGVGLPDGGTGVYAMASRANHSCSPTATFRIKRNGELALVALRALRKDDEVTVSYATEKCLLRPRPERRRFLRRWGFTCSCPRCARHDDTRAFLCPACGRGRVAPEDDDGAAWSACSSCAAAPPAAVMAPAESRWSKAASSACGPRGGKSSAAMRHYQDLRQGHERQRGRGCAEGDAPVPISDGHWVAALLSQEAAEAFLQRGDYAAAAEAARWRWRYAKRALSGASSRTAADALALRASAVALAAQLGRCGREERATMARTAHRRYGTALRELRPLVPAGDERLASLERQRGLLDLLFTYSSPAS